MNSYAAKDKQSAGQSLHLLEAETPLELVIALLSIEDVSEDGVLSKGFIVIIGDEVNRLAIGPKFTG